MRKCDRCGNDAVIFRRYSGESLCARHFKASLERKVLKGLRAAKLKYGATLAVAFSGGKDSTVLLHILAKLVRERFPESRIVALTVDEGIGGYRDEALEYAKATVVKEGVDWLVKSFRDEVGADLDKIASKSQRSPCAYCGVFRRRLLDMAAKEVGANVLLTAHNLDDEAQTIVLNAMYNNFSSLVRRDVLPGFVQRVKPLASVPEKEVALYAYMEGLKFQTKPCPYARLSPRYFIRTFLNELEESSPTVKFSILSFREELRRLAKWEVKLKACPSCGSPTPQDLCKFCQLRREVESLTGA